MRCRSLSLTAQLIGLLVAGLLTINLIAMLTDNRVYGDIPPLEKKQAVERLVVAYRLFETCAPCDTDALLHGLNHGQATFRLSTANPLADHVMDDAEWTLAALIESAGKLPENSVTVARSWDIEWPFTSFATHHSELTSVLQIGDAWLVARQPTPVLVRWWHPLLFSLPASVLPVLLLVILFTHRLLRPLGKLEATAVRISLGDTFAPLALQGPREIRSLIAAFNHMQENLARHIRDKTHMLAALSHDLRTPLTSLRLRAELLDDGEHKDGMIRTLSQLQGMVDEALAFLRDDAVREKLQEIDVAQLLTAIADLRNTLGQEVDYCGPLKFTTGCYPLALSRAVDNLLDNALRYGSFAAIRLEISSTGWNIRIKDDGPGIPTDWLERVFEPFVRIDAQRSSTGNQGVGLGLCIVRSCIERHGGTIRLHNGGDGGLEATISLPFAPASP